MADAFNCFGSWLLGSWLQPDRDVTVCLCDFGAEKAESTDPFFDVLGAIGQSKRSATSD